jgi:hypothetical protein
LTELIRVGGKITSLNHSPLATEKIRVQKNQNPFLFFFNQNQNFIQILTLEEEEE